MKQLFGVIAAVLAAMPVSAAWFGQSSLYGPNFVVLGDFIDYTISVSAAATAAPSATIVDPLPPGLEFVGGSLACSGGSGSCSYDGPTRTVSWAGSLAAWQTVTISFSVTTTALAGPGYVTNEAIADDPGLDALVLLRTSCVHYPEEQMLLGPIASVAPHGSGFAMTQGSGVAWNAAVENYLTAWISTNSSVYDVQVRTVDPSGALGVVRPITSGQLDYLPSVSCSGVSGNCLAVWDRQELSPSSDLDVLARLLDSTGQPLGPEFAIAQGSGSQHGARVVYNSALDEFLVVFWNMWHDGLKDVAAQRVQASNGALLSWANIATGTDGNRRDLRAAHLSERDQYLLVYEFWSAATGYEIRAKIAPGNLSGVSVAPEITIAASSANDELPAVAAGGDQYLVAWLHTENVLGASGIRARAVSGDGTPIGGINGFRVSEFLHPAGYTMPLVHFAGEHGFLVGWDHDDSTTLTMEDTHGRFVELDSDQAAFLEFPTYATVDWDYFGHFACSGRGDCLMLRDGLTGIDGRFVVGWRIFSDGFEISDTSGWSSTTP